MRKNGEDPGGIALNLDIKAVGVVHPGLPDLSGGLVLVGTEGRLPKGRSNKAELLKRGRNIGMPLDQIPRRLKDLISQDPRSNTLLASKSSPLTNKRL